MKEGIIDSEICVEWGYVELRFDLRYTEIPYGTGMMEMNMNVDVGSSLDRLEGSFVLWL